MSGRLLTIVGIVVAGLLVTGCDAGEIDLISDSATESPVPTGTSQPLIEVIARGEHMQYNDAAPRFLVITAPAYWQTFWQTYLPGERVTPEVDFGRSIILVGIQGAKDTGGYEIRFTDLEVSRGKVQVTVALEEPAPDAPVQMMHTQPYVVVEVDRDRFPSGGSATFVFQTGTGEQVGEVTAALTQNRDIAPAEPMPTDPMPPMIEAFAGAQVLAEGDRLLYEDPEPRFLVLTTQQELDQFWKTYLPGGSGVPQVDWTDAFVLAGIQGNKSTGGYDVSFEGLEQQGGEVRVVTELMTPSPDEPVDMAFSQPYVVVLIDEGALASRGALTFVFETPGGMELARVPATIE
jgi:hypothetical protein